MKRLILAGLFAAVASGFVVEEASAQLFGQGPGYGPATRRSSRGLPSSDVFGIPRRTTTRSTTRRRPTYRTNTGSNWINRGYPVTSSNRRRTRTTYRRPVVRRTWQVYTTAFTKADADSVVAAIKRGGGYSYARRRVINYRPRARVLWDVMIYR